MERKCKMLDIQVTMSSKQLCIQVPSGDLWEEAGAEDRYLWLSIQGHSKPQGRMRSCRERMDGAGREEEGLRAGP